MALGMACHCMVLCYNISKMWTYIMTGTPNMKKSPNEEKKVDQQHIIFL